VSRRLTVWLLAPLLAVTLSGCVYYNTFYHARAAAREAELLRQSRPPGTEPSAQELERLERVVEKCGRVIKLHPDSSWADDALVLMGEALYRQGKYETAEERFSEFLTLYPESELRLRAEYLLAAILLAKGNAVTAEEILTDVAFAQPPSELSDDALLLIGDARRSRKRYAEAAQAYAELLNRFPGSERRAEVRFVAAENYIDMGRLEEAARELDAVAGERGSRQLAFEAKIRLAEVLVDLGNSERALGVLDDLERRTTARSDLDRVLLTRGRTHETARNFDEAISTYREVASAHERSDAAAEAYYRIGLIERDHALSFDDAVASLREAKEQSPRSEFAGLAGDATADIESLRGYLSVIAAGETSRDSTVAAPGESTSRESTAVSVIDTNAVSAPPVAEPIPSDSLRASDAGERDAPADPQASAETSAARAATDTVGGSAVAGDSLTGLPAAGDTVAGAATGDTTAGPPAPGGTPPGPGTVGDGPIGPPVAGDSPIGPPAGWAAAEEEESEVAIARFRVAELYLFRLDNPLEALAYYESVVDRHPSGKLAPKAAYAVGWIREHRTGELEDAAEAYRDVVERFPGTEHARAAEEAIARLESRDRTTGEEDAGDLDARGDRQEGREEKPAASD